MNTSFRLYQLSFGKVSLRFRAPTYGDPIGFIVLTHRMDRMVGEEGIKWESAKLDPLDSQTESSIPADI